MKGKWSPGKILATVFGGIFAGIVLLATFSVGLQQLFRGNPFFGFSRAGALGYEGRYAGARDRRFAYDYDDRFPEPDSPQDDPPVEDFKEDESGGEKDSGEGDKKDWPGDGYGEEASGNSEYYEFHNEIRNDLSYQLDFQYYGGQFGDGNVSAEVIYPVVSGYDGEDFSGINMAIQKELDEVKEYADSVPDWLPEGSVFSFETESYITYMDEDVLSIIYVEYGYLDEKIYETYVIPVNIDMESKMAFTNSQMLDIDDDFSIDFRRRCEKQNGEVTYFDYFSDQDITELLSDDDSLIIFYTPLGMEVGFNYYYGWVTVTYRDYQKYQSHF